MSNDLELAHAHFARALSVLARRSEPHGRTATSLNEAKTAHGAGLRRLSRVACAPWLASDIERVSALAQQAERGIRQAENEERTGRYFILPG